MSLEDLKPLVTQNYISSSWIMLEEIFFFKFRK